MIDVKKLAKQACLVEDNFFKVPLYRSMGASSGLTVADLEAFAELVLEAAAVECDKYSSDQWALYKGRKPYTGQEPGRYSPDTQERSDGADICATAIRAMKPAKEQKT